MQPLQHARTDVGKAGTDRSEQPFLGAGAQVVDWELRQIDSQGAHGLDGIDNQEHILPAKRRAERAEVHAKTIPELDRADGQHPRPLIAQPADGPHLDPSIRRPVQAELDTLAAQVHPGIDVGGELAINPDDIVA